MTVKTEMSKLRRWFDRNKLALNLEKTKYMLFGNRKVNFTDQMINNINIKRVYENKFLGVILDYKIMLETSYQMCCNPVKNKTHFEL